MKTRVFYKTALLVLAAVVYCLTGCQSGGNTDEDSTTQGTIAMISSEDIAPVMDTIVHGFQGMYDKAHVLHSSASVREAVGALLNDSVKMIAISRPFNAAEESVITKFKLEIDRDSIALDGVAVLVNEKLPAVELTVTQLRRLLSGTVTNWRQLSPKFPPLPVTVAMVPYSGVHEYLITRILRRTALGAPVEACKSSPDIIASVGKHQGTIGFVGFSWLRYATNIFEPPAATRLLNIADSGYAQEMTPDSMEFFRPHPAYVYRHYYPLPRTLYLYSKNLGRGVGLGFASFIKGNEGQKIFTMNGLVPATRKVRLVRTNTQ
ncbi:MAG: substrate-binding domain-containing protein [Ignavibacteriales bacterium]|nr:substrate-binding domain-containing protein [Ignavibacteriales bacterium]